jgi:hypothetical protein
MNCSSARNRILALPDPAAPSESLIVHVNSCPGCQAWHRAAVQVDAAVASLAVPVTDGSSKRQLLSQFRTQPARVEKPKKSAKPVSRVIKSPLSLKATVRPAGPRQPLGERLARLWPAGLVAAAILVGAVSWAIFGGKSKENAIVASAGPDPMLKDIVAAKVKLDTAPDAAARVEVFANLADTIHEEARTLAKVTPGEDMNSLAKMYEQIVREGLVPQARAMSEEERRAKLPAVKQKLEEAEQTTNRLLGDGVPVGSDQALKDIAETAKAGRIELAKLIQGSAL